MRPADDSPARLLIAVYGFFALAAGARSAVQLVTRAAEAPVAYGLSALAAVVYLSGTAAMIALERTPRARPVAIALCVVELGGVVTVGALSLAAPGLFPRPSVWSAFGLGYGFVPAVLPVLALAWLLRGRPAISRGGGGRRIPARPR
jgi:hypothetical protein